MKCRNKSISRFFSLFFNEDIQYELLSELTERRKENSWNKMHQMPKSGSGFSGFQMQRLLNRSKVQKTKENIGKEIGDETVKQMDANLFVGDVEGLKKAQAEKFQAKLKAKYVVTTQQPPPQTFSFFFYQTVLLHNEMIQD